jgi:hypothetical protein
LPAKFDRKERFTMNIWFLFWKSYLLLLLLLLRQQLQLLLRLVQKQLEYYLLVARNLLNNENIHQDIFRFQFPIAELNLPAIHIPNKTANNCGCIVYVQSMNDSKW